MKKLYGSIAQIVTSVGTAGGAGVKVAKHEWRWYEGTGVMMLAFSVYMESYTESHERLGRRSLSTVEVVQYEEGRKKTFNPAVLQVCCVQVDRFIVHESVIV